MYESGVLHEQCTNVHVLKYVRILFNVYVVGWIIQVCMWRICLYFIQYTCICVEYTSLNL